MLAYALNDQPLPFANGAPLRLRVERQLGYKMAKYVMRIEPVDSFAAIGGGNGGFWEDQATSGTRGSRVVLRFIETLHCRSGAAEGGTRNPALFLLESQELDSRLRGNDDVKILAGGRLRRR